MNILYISHSYPHKGMLMGSFVKKSIDAVAKQLNDCDNIELLCPVPHVLPFSWFPYHKLYEVPQIPYMDIESTYTMYSPRFWFPIPKKLFYHLAGKLYYLSLINYVKKHISKPDIIHCHILYPDGYLAMKLSEYWNIPYIIHVRGSDVKVNPHKYPKLKPVLKKILNKGSKIICVSNDLQREVKKLIKEV